MSDDSREFRTLWEQALRSGRSARLDGAEDRAFWEDYAPHYDERIGSDTERVTLDFLRSLVRTDDTLLDVGAGTGRFAIPLCDEVHSISAVDHSPHMLDILRRKIAAIDTDSITTTEGEWPHVEVKPHDVVLAAWSLYRSVDLHAALQACVAATRRSLVIIMGVGDSPPHRRHVTELFGRWGESTVPGHLYVAGVLWEMGLLAEVRILRSRRLVAGSSPIEVARSLAPVGSADSTVDELAARLGSHIRTAASGYEYQYDYGVGVVTWNRDEE